MIVNKTVSDIKLIKIKNITWEQINKRPILVNVIKDISLFKAQEYILADASGDFPFYTNTRTTDGLGRPEFIET